jgi:hypothetical protein
MEATVSEFDNMKDKAGQYAEQHPDQVEKGEDAVERKLGIGEQDQAGQGQDNQGQGGPQDQGGGN